MNFRVALLLWLLNYTSAQDANCDYYYQNVRVGKSYSIYSPGWPRNYAGRLQCRWIAKCPSGYNCRLDCSVIRLPQSPSCNMDRLLISKSGDLQLTGANTYCGSGSAMTVSTAQRITMGLITSKNTPGGNFRCQLTAQPVTSSIQ